jgi:hypothetical protein
MADSLERDEYGLGRALREPLLELRDAYLAAAEQVLATLEGINELLAVHGLEGARAAPAAGLPIDVPRPKAAAATDESEARERTVRMEIRGGDIARMIDFQERLGQIQEVSRVSVIGLEGDRATLLVELDKPQAPTTICMGCDRVLAEGGPKVSHGLCDSCAAAFKSQRRVRGTPAAAPGDVAAAGGA